VPRGFELELRTFVDEVDKAALTELIASQRTLEDVVRWGLSLSPPRLIADLVVMDEYTHDVVIAYNKQLYLVYDTT
jgi:hypothetical protein